MDVRYQRCRTCGFTIRVILCARPDGALVARLRETLATRSSAMSPTDRGERRKAANRPVMGAREEIGMARRSSSFPGHPTPSRVCALIIVARDQEDLRQALGRTVGSCAAVQIVRDRRNGERRQGDHRPAAERRYGDRRHVSAPAEDPQLRQYVVARPRDRAPRD